MAHNNIREMLGYSKHLSKIFQEYTVILNKYFGISNFGYLQLGFDCRYFYTCNNAPLIKDYATNIKSTLIFFEEYINTSDNDFKIILWPNVPSHYSMELYLKHDYWNGLTLLQKSTSGYTLWWFAAHKDNTSINDFYLKHADTLVKFTKYFSNQFHSKFQFKENLFGIFPEGLNLSNMSHLPTVRDEQERIHSFFAELNKKKLKIITPSGESTTISSRERECLKLISEGKIIKEVARSLDIAPRTVESYFEKLRRKTGCLNKSRLIDLYREQIAGVF